jgi:hypothetical protein
MTAAPREFDARALYDAMDAERRARRMSWRQVADAIWEQSAVLNARRRDRPISPTTLTGIAKRHDTTCQHALFILRWLARSPESFVTGAVIDAPLPVAGPDRRLRWSLLALYEAVDARRRERRLTWTQLARELRCGPSQLTGIRTARYAISMRLAMRIVQWLGQPASAFVYLAEW